MHTYTYSISFLAFKMDNYFYMKNEKLAPFYAPSSNIHILPLLSSQYIINFFFDCNQVYIFILFYF